ncbi:MAG: ATPase, partial [Clostridia bacterium]|nr:ATPase [Clostridia bacterium]
LLTLEDEVIPVEVKASNNTTSKSLSAYMTKYSPKYAIRISSKNFGYQNNIKSIPLYAVHLI